jgi:hypothetical protein
MGRSPSLRQFVLVSVATSAALTREQACPYYDENLMEVGDQVQLISFNGKTLPPDDTDPAENYWLLCGQKAEIVALATTRTHAGRALVKFAVSVSALGLHCHNRVPNSLWILRSDLAVLS